MTRIMDLASPGITGIEAARIDGARTYGVRLTQRESQVLEQVLAGRRNRETAEILAISVRTVEAHRASLMTKYGARCVLDLLRVAGTPRLPG